VRVVVDTGVFSAALSRRRRPAFDRHVQFLVGQQLFLASISVAELRFGALVAEWGEARRERLERAVQSTTVVPVTDDLLTRMAELRYACRQLGHPLGDRAHGNDLAIAATAVQIGAVLVTADGVFQDVPGLSLGP
jgi:predicted nucleic acid-binding protein